MENKTRGTDTEQSTARMFDEMIQIQPGTWKQLADVQMKLINPWREYLNAGFQPA